MKLSKIFLISVFLTAVILAVIGGLVSNVFAEKKTVDQPTSAEIQAYTDREAAYNKLIEQANQQLQKANQDLKTLQEQVAKQPQPVMIDQPTQPSVAISVEKANELATQVAAPGQNATRKPELVDFEGKTAYEIPYPNGSIYLDAQSGAVLFNGTVPQEVTLEMATQVAKDFMKNTDVVQADEITFRGAPIYRVIFKNSSIVYLDKTGQITYIIQNSMVSHQTVDNGGGGGNPPPPQREHDDHNDD
jgi:hypothetical protein